MITSISQIPKLSGPALLDEIAFGKHRGKYLWEVPDNYWQYMEGIGACNYGVVITKVNEALKVKSEYKDVAPVVSTLPKYTASDLPSWLYDYQVRELLRISGMSRAIINGCIGSGKTLLALVLSELYGYKKALITCPQTIHRSWIGKIVERTGQSYIRLNGTIDERTDILKNTNYTYYLINQESFMDFEADITKLKKSQELMAKKKESYKALLDAMIKASFEFAFFDESHLYLQNHSTSIYKSVKSLLKYIPNAYLMTGTFFTEGREERAVDQLHLINPSLFGNKAITKIYKEWFYLDSYYKPAAIKPEYAPILAKIIADNSIIIRPEELKLPKPIHEVRDIIMHGDQLQAYIKASKEMEIELTSETVDITAKIALIVRQRQISGGVVLGHRFKDNGKIKELIDVISEYGKESFAVVCQYLDEIELVKETLTKKKYSVCVVSGNVTGHARDEAIESFIEKRNQVILLQLDTGGVGIDGLQQVCRFCVIYSSTYQSSRIDQLVGRFVRTGQSTNVVFTWLKNILPVADMSIDEKMELSVSKKIEREKDFIDLIMEKR